MRALGTLPRSHLPARLFWPATLGVIGFFCAGLFAAYVIFLFMPKPPSGTDIGTLAGIGLLPGGVALVMALFSRMAWKNGSAGVAATLAILPPTLFVLLAIRVLL